MKLEQIFSSFLKHFPENTLEVKKLNLASGIKYFKHVDNLLDIFQA